MSETIGTVGTILIVVGCYFVHPSLALIVGGGVMLFVGIKIKLRGSK